MRMIDRGKMKSDLPLQAEILKFSTVKLWTIVSNNGPRKSESTDDQLPNELSRMLGRCRGKNLGFDPLCEVVNDNNEIHSLFRGRGKGTK